MWSYPRVLAHRGAGVLAPENTLEAMQVGWEHGYRAVEFDVMLSKDGFPVLMHDPFFGRTVAGAGEVCKTLAQDLMKMDAGSWFSPAFAHARVPSYEAVFRFCCEHSIWMNVEIKPAPGHEQETGRVVAEITQRLMQVTRSKAAAPLLSSFSFDALMSAKLAAPGLARAFLMDTITNDWRSCLQQLDAIALHTNQKYLSPILAKKVKEARYGLFCYTVNSPERAREIFNWGVDGFCTDRIDLIPFNFRGDKLF